MQRGRALGHRPGQFIGKEGFTPGPSQRRVLQRLYSGRNVNRSKSASTCLFRFNAAMREHHRRPAGKEVSSQK